MTTVDVFWVARNPDFITRGYADCGFIEDIFNRRANTWTPPDALVFEHHDVRNDFPHHDGAVVAFSGMGNAPDADWLIGEIEKLPWCLVLILGNECWDFPWQRLVETARRKVWVMNPTPEHAHLSNRIPGGPYPRTHENLKAFGYQQARPLDWFFAGQVTNKRRIECVDVLHREPRGQLIETDRFMGGIPREECDQITATAKVIPCPSGPMTLDANRPLAALEAGCVPVLDLVKPSEPQFDYWSLVFGDDYPLLVIEDWAQFPEIVDFVLGDWARESSRSFSWWQQWKRRTTLQLDADIRVAMQESAFPDVNDMVTVIVTSSVIPSHPSTDILEQTIASIRSELPTAEIIIVMDGLRHEQQDRKADYDEYVRRVCWKTNFEWHNVLPVVMREWGHQANATRKALEFVNSDMILFVEHDTPIIGPIDWEACLDAIDFGFAYVIRFHEDVAIHPDHEEVMLDNATVVVNGFHGRRTKAFWARPHLAETQWYREMLNEFFPPESRTMIEDRVYSPAWIDCLEGRWDRWKMWIWTPEGSIRRSGHLDGRGSQPKFDMFYGDEK